MPSVFGCDSVITLNLDIINANYTQQAQTICSNDSILFGSAYLHQSGVYFDSLLNSNGCDSIIELQLTVTPVITNIVSQISSTLQTTASGSTYQWIDCGNNTAINGATNSTFQPTNPAATPSQSPMAIASTPPPVTPSLPSDSPLPLLPMSFSKPVISLHQKTFSSTPKNSGHPWPIALNGSQRKNHLPTTLP
ncbi:MAG: hypothetical protein IPP46_07735 [Bacteroidetes bacterium]|nr:hypothetical protein [Bacteroidota bacterium]